MRRDPAPKDAVSAFRAGKNASGRYPMTMQREHRGRGLANNMAAQMTILVVAVGVLIAIAWFYVW